MKLSDYLRDENIAFASFAPRIGVANASVVSRYASGRVPRSPAVRTAIVRESGGKVQLADLYDAAVSE